MSVAVEAGIERLTCSVRQQDLADFFRTFKQVREQLDVFVYAGCFGVSDGDVAYIIDCTQSPEVSCSARLSKKELAKYVRSAGKGNLIEIVLMPSETQDLFDVTVDSPKLGVKEFRKCKPGWARLEELIDMYEHASATIPEVQVARAERPVKHCDIKSENQRFALSGVLFDDNNIIGTDGRTLCHATCDGFPGVNALIPATQVTWAIKNNYSLVTCVDKEQTVAVLAGDVISRTAEGRYPDWRQVVDGDLQESFCIDAAILHAICNKMAKQVKAGTRGAEDEREGREMDIKIDPTSGYEKFIWEDEIHMIDEATQELSITLDFNYVKRALPESGKVWFKYATLVEGDDDNTGVDPSNSPVLVCPEDSIDTVIMPMAR